ncbi:hypothetical protein U1Q18_011881, partial [Sarracenia purpurea var. burkii]
VTDNRHWARGWEGWLRWCNGGCRVGVAKGSLARCGFGKGMNTHGGHDLSEVLVLSIQSIDAGVIITTDGPKVEGTDVEGLEGQSDVEGTDVEGLEGQSDVEGTDVEGLEGQSDVEGTDVKGQEGQSDGGRGVV